MNINIEDFDSEETRRLLKRAIKIQEESNPYSHIQEVSEIRKFFKRRRVKVENLLAEVEKYRANPHIVAVTCGDGRSINFVKIVTIIKVVVDGTKCEILLLSDGRIVGGHGFDRLTQPGFMVVAHPFDIMKNEYSLGNYVEITSLKVCDYIDENKIVESNPISPWAFDTLTKYILARRYSPHDSFIISFNRFILNSVVDRLRVRCEEFSQTNFLITCLLKGDTNVFDLPLRSLLINEQCYGGGEMIRILESYIGDLDLLHMPPPEEWDISLKDILTSQLVGDALEGK